MERGRSRADCRTGTTTARIVGWIAVVACLAWPSAAASLLLEEPTLRATDPSSELHDSLRTGAYDRVQTLARRHDAPPTFLARAFLAELDGKLEEALRIATVARRQATEPATKRLATWGRARLLRALGRWDEAESLLRETLSNHPSAHAIRLELGSLLIDRGRRAEAEPILDQLATDYNAGRLQSRAGLSDLGRGMALLGSFQDANDAYQYAWERNGTSPSTLVAWAELLLTKYNTGDARQTLKDALSINSNHPGALAAMARVLMESRRFFDRARRYLDRAAEVAPHSPDVLLTRAELALYDGDGSEAVELTDRVLDSRPRHLRAFAIQAAAHYLNDDTEAFETTRREAFEIRSDYAELLTTTAEYAVLGHRYREGVELNRRALKLDDDNPEALMGLGTGLSRLGKLDEAVEALKRAHQADRYNVRAYNMLEFFETTLPSYAALQREDFLLRVHQSEQTILASLVPPLVSDAIATYRDKYDFEPDDELSVEIYPDPQTFGVRTVGLPNISPHGICFGRVVATRSPSDGNFNWKQVLWHEMAHVFHIQESNYRVPRWFTEGLAEYETNVERAAWVRHHERSIASALRHDELPSIVNLDKRFTQAKSYRDILRAYHLSSLVLHFIVDEWDFEAVERMVEAFRTELRTRGVIERVLEVDVETFDRKLRAWLSERLMNFESQMLVDLRDLPERSELTATPEDERSAWDWARLAILRQKSGGGDVEAALERALDASPDAPRIHYVASAVYAGRGDARRAYRHGIQTLDHGGEDYVLRLRLGRLALQLERRDEARIHLKSAVQLYPDGAGAWKELRTLAETSGETELARRALRRLFELDQTNPDIARDYARRAVAREAWGRAETGVERWLAIQPFNPDLHQMRAKVSLEIDQVEDAEESWNLLLALRPASRSELLVEAVRQFREYGHEGRASDFAKRAREAGVPASQLE
jgi:tetratricopeptide (TPR) repeat protein